MARCKGSVGGGDDADISELNERFSGHPHNDVELAPGFGYLRTT